MGFGFQVWGLGFKVLVFGVWGSGFGYGVWEITCRSAAFATINPCHLLLFGVEHLELQVDGFVPASSIAVTLEERFSHVLVTHHSRSKSEHLEWF